ncbi:MAG: hypothetical protein AAFQ53_14950, partial [Bacteroidota bacterium]
ASGVVANAAFYQDRPKLTRLRDLAFRVFLREDDECRRLSAESRHREAFNVASARLDAVVAEAEEAGEDAARAIAVTIRDYCRRARLAVPRIVKAAL